MLIYNYDWARSIMRRGWRLKAEKANLLNKCGCCCMSKFCRLAFFFLNWFLYDEEHWLLFSANVPIYFSVFRNWQHFLKKTLAAYNVN